MTRPAATQTGDLAIVLPCPGAERYWPRFRGPSGQGDTQEKSLPIEWDKDGRNIVWRTKVPGAGRRGGTLFRRLRCSLGVNGCKGQQAK